MVAQTTTERTTEAAQSQKTAGESTGYNENGQIGERETMVTKASANMDFAIAQAAARWLREHGYFISWDVDNGCYRVMLEGIDRKDDTPYPAGFSTVQSAYRQAFRLAAGEEKLP